MSIEGIIAYCAELGISHTDMPILYIAHALEAKAMGQFTRAEFVRGWTALGCDTIAAMRSAQANLANQYKSKATFDKMYKWLFHYANGEPKKSLPIQVARPLWQLVMQGRFTLLDQWIAFLADRTQSVPKDAWDLLPAFAELTVHGVPDSYEAGDAWPSMYDEFVAYVRGLPQ